MKAAVLLVLGIISVPALAQTHSNPRNLEVTGKCNVANSGNNNTITIKCGVDQALGKQMVEILNKILANQIDPTAVMKKLDEILAAESRQRQSQTCIESNCAGTNNGSQSLTNNYGQPQPPPQIIDLKVTPLAPSKPGAISLEGPLATNPGVSVDFGLSGIFNNPMFLIVCNRPCAATMGGAWPGINSNAATYSIRGNPNVTVIALSVPRVDLGKRVNISVRSADANGISVLDVKAFVPPVSGGQ